MRISRSNIEKHFRSFPEMHNEVERMENEEPLFLRLHLKLPLRQKRIKKKNKNEFVAAKKRQKKKSVVKR